MTEPLFKYQDDGAAEMAMERRMLNADEPGLGKTAQACKASDLVEAKRFLIICPASVVTNWARELRRFRQRGVEGSLIVSYDRATIQAAELRNMRFDAIALDESHYCKTKDAKRTQAVYGPECDGQGGIIERIPYVWPLSGTPAPNNPLELWPTARAVFPEAIEREYTQNLLGPEGVVRSMRPLSHTGFLYRYCKTRNTGYDVQITGGRNLKELRERLARHVIRRKADDVLPGLPPMRFTTFPLEMRRVPEPDTAAELAINYALEHDDSMDALEKVSGQCATYRRILGIAKVVPLAARVRDELDDGLNKIVVYAYHTEVLRRLYEELLEYEPCVITGAVPQHKRQPLVDKFTASTRSRVFLGQIDAVGTGTDGLQHDCYRGIFAESSWNPSQDNQAARRLRRYPQKRSVLMSYAYIPNSLDERIAERQRRKTETVRQIFD